MFLPEKISTGVIGEHWQSEQRLLIKKITSKIMFFSNNTLDGCTFLKFPEICLEKMRVYRVKKTSDRQMALFGQTAASASLRLNGG